MFRHWFFALSLVALTFAYFQDEAKGRGRFASTRDSGRIGGGFGLETQLSNRDIWMAEEMSIRPHLGAISYGDS